MNIFLRYEITVRELDANILTGLIAASRGHRAVVCDWSTMMRGILLRRRQPGFVHMNSLAPGQVTLIFHRIFKFFGYRISSMDQEAGIQLLSYDSSAKTRYGEATVSNADLIFCWGRDDHETLQRLYPKHRDKIIMTGSPRVDLWRPKFSSLYVFPEQTSSPFVVILSSIVGPLSSRRLHEELISHRRSGYFDRDSKMESRLVGQYREGASLMLAYLDLLRFLSRNYQELLIVVKPHPIEDPEIWRGILGEMDRVRVDTEAPTSQLIRESMAVITSGSTTAFEAELSQTPLISYQPTETPHRNYGFADRLGTKAETPEEVGTVLDNFFSARRGNGLKALPKPAKEDVKKKVYFDDEQLAAERMVDSWERALRIDSQLPESGSVFSMPLEDFKYLVASAFPFLIPFFVRKGVTSLSSGARKNRKRPPLNRKLVRARVQQMRLILGLQDSVSYRFKGRRGLVFEPSPSFSIKGNPGI